MKTLLSSWLHRRKVQAEVLKSGRPIEVRTVTNPFHAVSVVPVGDCCQQARSLLGVRFLSREAPPIPLKGCDASSCRCRYQHFDDRRSGEDRRVADPWNVHAGAKSARAERRDGRGRRHTDH